MATGLRTPTGQQPENQERDNLVSRMALGFTEWTEKWLPDAFGFVLIGTLIIFVLGLLTGEGPDKMVDSWGRGFWSLITFTFQMALIIIGGYALATSRPMSNLIAFLAKIPSTPRIAIVFTAFVSMFTCYLNWAFGLIFSAVLAKEIARLVPRTDYRAIGAMSFLGLGTVWAQGFSGSAALQVANKASSPEAVQKVVAAGRGGNDGLIPLTQTIFLWQSFVSVFIVVVVVLVAVYFLAPSAGRAVTAQDLGIQLQPLLVVEDPNIVRKRRPGDFLEYTPYVMLLFVAIGLAYLFRYFITSNTTNKSVLDLLDFNTINMILIILGLLLHWRPFRFMNAVKDGTTSAAGVLIQYPLYGGIFGMIVYTGVSKRIADFLVSISNQTFYPAIVAIYSCILGIFVPSGGSKWSIEAPYVIDAANQLHVNQGWMVVVYDLGEASANLLQPFWMLPVLGILGLKARDVMGYTFAVFLICFPLVLVLVTVLGMTLSFP